MAADPNLVEQAVSRTLRDNLEKIQRTSEELHRAINDLVSACASSRPTNALPPMVRAQVSAASLSAVLEVLSRFVTVALRPALQPSPAIAVEPAPPAEVSAPRAVPEPPAPQLVAPEPAAPQSVATEPTVSEPVVPVELAPEPFVPEPLASEPVTPQLFVPEPLAPQPMSMDQPLAEPSLSGEFRVDEIPAAEEPFVQEPEPLESPSPAATGFDVTSLPTDQQELHRRAYRVAKVSMQDIKMLRPEEVRMGLENRDLCFRLRDDIEKAHKEYTRRFDSILSHPVDYFYDWMVEILASGDAQALGEYPYPSAVLHR